MHDKFDALLNIGDFSRERRLAKSFDDQTGNRNTADPRCIMHNRPFKELATDLGGSAVARYNFITPNLCDDMHDSCAPTNDQIKQGDDWLKTAVPMILDSASYKDGGALFITFDESVLGDLPIGMIVLSAQAKAGYSNSVKYTHSSLLRSLQTIFGVQPFLRDAANATDLADLFTRFP